MGPVKANWAEFVVKCNETSVTSETGSGKKLGPVNKTGLVKQYGTGK